MNAGCFLQTRLSKTLDVSIDQKAWSSICFKTCGGAFEKLSRAFKTLSRAFQTIGRAFEGLRENQKLGQEFEKLGRVFCYNTAYAVPITHGSFGYSSPIPKPVLEIGFSHWKVDERSSYLQRILVHVLSGRQKYTAMSRYEPR